MMSDIHFGVAILRIPVGPVIKRYRQSWFHGCGTCAVSQGSETLGLMLCCLDSILECIIIFESFSESKHFALGPASSGYSYFTVDSVQFIVLGYKVAKFKQSKFILVGDFEFEIH